MKKIANILVPAILFGTPAIASSFSRLNSRQKNRKTISISESVENKNLRNQSNLNKFNPFDSFSSSIKTTEFNKKDFSEEKNALAFLKEEGLLESKEQKENLISGERKEFAYVNLTCVSGVTYSGNSLTKVSSESYYLSGSSIVHTKCLKNNNVFILDSSCPQALINACNNVTNANLDANLTASATIDESSMILIPSTADTLAEKVDIFDFTISDGGTDDGFSTDIIQIELNTSGTADFSKVAWILNGDDVSDKNGTFNSNSDILSFTDLNISVPDGGSETYKISAYFSNNSGLTDNATFGLSLDGTNIEANSSKTQFGLTSTITNSENAKVDITATQLYFLVLPSQ